MGLSISDKSMGLKIGDKFSLLIAISIDIILFVLSMELALTAMNTTEAIPEILNNSDQSVAEGIKRLTKIVSATEFNSKYVIPYNGKYYIAVNKRAYEGERSNQNARMSSAMVAMDVLGLFRRLRFEGAWQTRLRRTLLERGLDVPDGAGFDIWVAERNVVPEIIGRLMAAEKAPELAEGLSGGSFSPKGPERESSGHSREPGPAQDHGPRKGQDRPKQPSWDNEDGDRPPV